MGTIPIEPTPLTGSLPRRTTTAVCPLIPEPAETLRRTTRRSKLGNPGSRCLSPLSTNKTQQSICSILRNILSPRAICSTTQPAPPFRGIPTCALVMRLMPAMTLCTTSTPSRRDPAHKKKQRDQTNSTFCILHQDPEGSRERLEGKRRRELLSRSRVELL